MPPTSSIRITLNPFSTILTVYKTCVVHAHNMRYTLSEHALSMYFTGITHVTKRITVTVSEADYQTLQAIALENDRSVVAQMGRMIRTWSEVTKPTLLPQGNTSKPTKPEPEPAPVLTPEEKEAIRLARPYIKQCFDPNTGDTWEIPMTVGEHEEEERQKWVIPKKKMPDVKFEYAHEDEDVLPVAPSNPTA